MKILIINTINEKNSLHFDEFVKPIENILKLNKINFKTHHFLEINNKILENFDKIIICGTALKDFNYLETLQTQRVSNGLEIVSKKNFLNINKFNWIKNCNKVILGICSGFQIIGLIYGAKLIEKEEIGMVEIKKLKNNILFKKENFEVYSLHKKALTNLSKFEILAESKNCIQAIKLKNRKVYGVLFHPEVKCEFIIENFVKN